MSPKVTNGGLEPNEAAYLKRLFIHHRKHDGGWMRLVIAADQRLVGGLLGLIDGELCEARVDTHWSVRITPRGVMMARIFGLDKEQVRR